MHVNKASHLFALAHVEDLNSYKLLKLSDRII